MKEIELTLPYPPNINHYKRRGRTIITKTGKTYQQSINTDVTNRFFYEVWVIIRAWMVKNRMETAIGEAIYVEAHVFPPDKRKRDLDGILKVLLDSLQRGGLIVDDNQIARLFVERKNIIPKGQIILRIKPL